MIDDECAPEIELYYETLDRMLVEIDEALNVNDKRIEELFREIVIQRWATHRDI